MKIMNSPESKSLDGKITEEWVFRRSMLAGALGLSILWGAGIRAATAETMEAAVERLGIQKSLSKDIPAWVTKLPSFGTIEWTVKTLPFVSQGPRGGISGAGMVAIDGQIYLMGGFIPAGDETGDSPTGRTSRWTHRYDPKSDRWTRLPDMPGRREYLRAIAAGTKIYALGGGLQENPRPLYSAAADVFCLSLDRKPMGWEAAGKLTVPRTHMAVGAIGQYLVVAGGNQYDFGQGGYSQHTFLGSAEVLDLAKPDQGWVQRSAMPGQRRGWAASAVLGERLYVLGGITITDKTWERIQETLCYEPATDQWTRRTDPPAAISGWSGGTYQNRYVIVVGGVVGNGTWNDLPFAYDAKEDRWLKIESPMPPGALFNDSSVCIIENTIYVLGGEGPHGSHFNHFLVGRIKNVPAMSPSSHQP